MTTFSIGESADPTGARADLFGTALSVVTMGSFVYALVTGPDAGWTSSKVLAAVAVCTLGLTTFARWELRTAHPMLPLAFLRRMTFAGPAIAEGALMFAAFGGLFLLTQLLQLVDGYSPLQAGLRTAPFAVGAMSSGVLSLRLSRRYGAHVGATAGYLLCAAGMATLAAEIRAGYWPLAIGMLVFGMGMRMAITPAAIAVIDALPAERAGMGSALNDTFQEIGGALGVAIIGSVFNVVYRADLPAHVPSVARSSVAGAFGLNNPVIARAATHAFGSGAQLAIWIGAAVMAATAFVVAKTVPPGIDVSEG